MFDEKNEEIKIPIERFYEYINDAILIFKNALLIYCNQSAADFLGYKKEEIIGKDYYFFSPKYQNNGILSADYIKEVAKEIYEKNHLFFEWLIEKKDGSVIITEISADLIEEGEEKLIVANIRDLSKQKKYEDDLRKSEELFRLLTENAQDVIYKLDIINKSFDYISPSIEKLTGYPQSDFYKSVDICEQIFSDEYMNFFNDLKNQFSEGKIALTYEYKIITKDKKMKWIHQSNSPIMDTNGKIVALEAVLRDITDLKNALLEKDLYFNYSLDMFAIAGMDGYLKEINPMWSKILGWSDEELLSKPWIEYVHSDDIENTLNAGKQLGEGKKVIQFDNRYLCKDGSYRWISWNSYPDVDSKKIFAVARDITDRKDIEKQIKDSEERLSFAMSATSDAIWDLDLVSQKNYFSPRFFTILDYEPNEFYPSFDNWFNLIHPDDKERIRKIINEHIDDKIKSFEIEFREKTKFGEWKWILARGKIVSRDENGKALRIVGTHTDITDRKRHEEERERLLNELSIKNKELESIIYVTSHDLRSPLVNIAGFSTEVKRSIKDVENKIEDLDISSEDINAIKNIFNNDISNFFPFIDRSIEKMDALIKGLLKYSRIGIVELNKENVDINELIDNILKTLNYEIKSNNVVVKVDKLENCVCDRDLINQVFTNLISNSIKYLSAKKSGLIKIHSFNTNEKNITYIIEDNGIGIAPEHNKKIFHLFHRLNPEDGKKGEGLGLSIVKKVVELHHGKIWVESSLNKGSKFYVQLPIN